MDSLFDLKGKTAVVTGGTGVLGGAMAIGLAKAGVKVGILGRSEKKAAKKIDVITNDGGEAIPLIADVLEVEELKEAKQKFTDHWGSVDILVNAAGGNMAGATVTPDQSFFDMPVDSLKRVLNLNFTGTVNTTKVFADTMPEKKQGVIINISSMAAERPMTRVMGYAAAKSAIDNYTKWLATELATKYGEGIRVNAIAPGFFVGEQNRDLLFESEGKLSDRGQTIVDHTPMKRFGEPEELIGTLLWLCSDASKFVTGTIIPVDGGFSAFSGV